MTQSVGILAFGSLIEDPGDEIAPHVTATLSCMTPFNVEFARTSKSRDGSPTLVPYEGGGSVEAKILVVDMGFLHATDALYRREIHEVGSSKTYREPAGGKRNSVRIRSLSEFEGVGTVLYTDIGANIEQPSAIELARLAIKSARARDDGKDGISYLRDALRNHIHTPLSDAYQRKILELVGGKDLDEALAMARASSPLKAGAPPGLGSIEHKLGLAEDYVLAASVLAAQKGPAADIRLLLPSDQLVAHAAEMLLKAMLEAGGLLVPLSHDLVELRHLLVSENHPVSDRLEFVVRNLGPLHAGHVFRYGDAGHGIPTARQMIDRLEPEIASFRSRLAESVTH